MKLNDVVKCFEVSTAKTLDKKIARLEFLRAKKASLEQDIKNLQNEIFEIACIDVNNHEIVGKYQCNEKTFTTTSKATEHFDMDTLKVLYPTIFEQIKQDTTYSKLYICRTGKAKV